MSPPGLVGTGPVDIQPPVNNSIDQGRVETALRELQAGPAQYGSTLADVLENPALSQAERNEILQEVARDPDMVGMLYGADSERAARGDYGALAADQQVIAEAMQQAWEDGAVTAEDLLAIADHNPAGNGAQRFLSLLAESPAAGQAGGVSEALADALWARDGNDGMDRAGAALFYASDPAMMSRNLNTPEARAEAFEALVAFNEQAPYADIQAGMLAEGWEDSALSAAGNLFISHGQELVDRYTSSEPGKAAETEVLARFMSHTVLNPNAQDIVLNRTQDLVPAVNDTIGNIAGDFLDAASAEGVSDVEASAAMKQLGQLIASVSGGSAVALTRYDAQINATEASREQFAGMIGSLVGEIPLGGGLAEKAVNHATGPLANEIAEMLIENPERPDQDVSSMLSDHFWSQADLLSHETGNPDLITSYESSYSYELNNLLSNLNVNPGGHA